MRITRIIFNFTYTRICTSQCEWCFMWYFFEKSPTYSCFMTFLIAGELSLPEELPEFPYEAEFIREIENAILKYGGREGVTLLKEHAIEQREVLESSMNQNLSAISIPIGTIHILRKHIFSPFGPPLPAPSLCRHIFHSPYILHISVTENKQICTLLVSLALKSAKKSYTHSTTFFMSA